ncbi:hypothetical protein [Treponema pedis]|uniref:hypothetical protein n=1 Tax=Treponema pedis TaxID=409322 RepID=UPI001CEF5890|nr:hypothetical protein [Treponema pedis]
MKEYIASLEKEFSLLENGFKEEEKRALTDFKSNDSDYIKKLAFLAYKSAAYQVRMYGVFLFGHLSKVWRDFVIGFIGILDIFKSFFQCAFNRLNLCNRHISFNAPLISSISS